MKKYIIGILIFIAVGITAITLICYKTYRKINTLKVDLEQLTYDTKDLKVYTQEEFEQFKKDYEDNNLPGVYITKFLFDGVGMYRPYDLDDYVENGNDYVTKPLEIDVLNINTSDNVELTGNYTGMVGINSNNLKNDINIILNNVNINTDSKKVPAIYVYNKDINYNKYKVNIVLEKGSKNYIEGGKLKKVSLIEKENLSNYTNKYSSEIGYEVYTNYYGVYTKEEIDKILFARVEADQDDLKDGDPAYFYKAAGAISSDIDLSFSGEGYLELKSKNKEGIEVKGNLVLGNGNGNYVIYAEDDCLNTTTTQGRNNMTINVNSLKAVVSLDASEGDAIDSNGSLTIEKGTVIALSKPGQDSGLDSNNGVYINGGIIISTGDMYDEIKSDSKQNFILLSFSEKVESGDLIVILDEKDNVILAFITDRTYTNLVFSSSDLKNGTYYVYKNGEINGLLDDVYYREVSSYKKGTLLGYSNKTESIGMGPQMNGERKDIPNGEKPNMEERKDMPNGEKPNMEERKEMPNREIPNNMEVPEMQDRNMRPEIDNANFEQKATNKEFIIDGISNLFSGVSTYIEE